ncbi:MAG: hypothetical protein MZV64_28280 [Ignavibacteriales bacterium]|nr:hypothetical protein [Ignavibacteriales bacterium]
MRWQHSSLIALSIFFSPRKVRRVVLDGDLDVVLAHVGQFGLDDQFVAARVVDVDRRRPGPPAHHVVVGGAVDVAKQPVHPVLDGTELTEQDPIER